MTPELTGIANAITALQALKDLIDGGSAPMWHPKPVAGNSLYLRTNAVGLPDGSTLAITLHMDPSADPAVCRFVSVQFQSYQGGVEEYL